MVDVMQPPPQTASAGIKEDATGPSLESVGSIGTTLTALDKSIRDTYRPFWFDDADGHPLARADAMLSGRATGVPGAIATFALALRDFAQAGGRGQQALFFVETDGVGVHARGGGKVFDLHA